MTSILDKICHQKQIEIIEGQKKISLSNYQDIIKHIPKPRPFADIMLAKKAEKQTALIAEIKKASPSKGIIRADFNPIEIAKSYEKGGACCLSVLTDEHFFQGKNDYLTQVRDVVKLPLLRKDFMLDEWQIFQSRALGADCILLIMAILSPAQAQTLEAVALELGMSVLIESHNQQELEQALQLKSPLIGINNRNLHHFTTDLAISQTLAPQIPDTCMAISESGIYTYQDIKMLEKQNIYGILVGESLMREENIENATRNLLTS